MEKNLENPTEPEISIIIPVYNVEKYVERCLDSIFNQKMIGRCEVIVVDDCSTDNSLEILKEYKQQQPALSIIAHEKNKKLSCARNSGMIVAKGKYIMHVDSDDWLLPDALETLYNKSIQVNADVIVFNYVRSNDAGESTTVKSIEKEYLTTSKADVQQFFLGAPWNKIVKRKFTKDLISGEVGINNTEDLIYASEIMLKVESIVLIPDVLYAYFVNHQSITRTVMPLAYLEHQALVLKQIQKIVNKYNPSNNLIAVILCYFEKFIYFEIAKFLWWQRNKIEINNALVHQYQNSQLLKDRVNDLKKSLSNKYLALWQIKQRFGLKLCIGILIRSFKISNS